MDEKQCPAHPCMHAAAAGIMTLRPAQIGCTCGQVCTECLLCSALYLATWWRTCVSYTHSVCAEERLQWQPFPQRQQEQQDTMSLCWKPAGHKSCKQQGLHLVDAPKQALLVVHGQGLQLMPELYLLASVRAAAEMQQGQAASSSSSRGHDAGGLKEVACTLLMRPKRRF